MTVTITFLMMWKWWLFLTPLLVCFYLEAQCSQKRVTNGLCKTYSDTQFGTICFTFCLLAHIDSKESSIYLSVTFLIIIENNSIIRWLWKNLSHQVQVSKFIYIHVASKCRCWKYEGKEILNHLSKHIQIHFCFKII